MTRRKISMVSTSTGDAPHRSPDEILGNLRTCQADEAAALLALLDRPLSEAPADLGAQVARWLAYDDTAIIAATVCTRHQLKQAIPALRSRLARTGALDIRLAVLAALAGLGERALFRRTIRSMLMHGKTASAAEIVACLDEAAEASDAAAIHALLPITPAPHRLRVAALAYRLGVIQAYVTITDEMTNLGSHCDPVHVETCLRAVARLQSQRFIDHLLDYATRESRPFFAARARSIAAALVTHGAEEATPAQLFEEAKTAYFQSEYEQADELLSSLFALGVAQTGWRHLHASCLRELGRHEEAQKTCERGLAMDPSHWQSHRLHGSILWDLKEYELALAAYDRALALNPTDGYGWYYKGYALHCLEDDEAALPCLDRALSLKKDSPYLYNQKAFCLERLGRHREATHCYRKSLTLQPHDPAVRDYLGQAHQVLGEYKTALACFDQVLRTHPDREDTLYHRADVLYDMEEWDACEQAYIAYIARRPSSYHAHFNRGLCLRFLKRFLEAAHCFERALEIRHDSATAKKHLAYCLKRSRQLNPDSDG